MNKISFASENFAGAHPAFLTAIQEANAGKVPSYGKDDYTAVARQLISDNFNTDCDVYFLFNGTGANNFALGSVVKPFNSIFCSDVSHLYMDESTAPEAFSGCRLYPVKSNNGKIIFEDLQEKLIRFGNIHFAQPAVLTISQPTEYGTVYSLEEIASISTLLKKRKMLLHVDGARFFNAAVSLNSSLGEMVKGVDVLTLGGTKNGMLFGEAVLFFNETRNPDHVYQLKRSMQLASKMRFVSVQFQTMFQNTLWHELASRANSIARYCEQKLKQETGLTISRPVETNAVFVKIPKDACVQLQEFISFFVWHEHTEETRLMFSFDSTEEEVDMFIEQAKLLRL